MAGETLIDLGYALVFLIVAIALLEGIVYSLWSYWRSMFFLPAVMIGGAVLSQRVSGDWLWGAGMGAAVGAFFRFWVKGQGRFPALMIAPAMVSVALVVIFPFLFELRLSFSNLNMYTMAEWNETGRLGFVWFDNYLAVFQTPVLGDLTFYQLFLRTILWTVINVVFHVGFGLALALLLNQKIAGKGIYRTLLIVPWAMPQVVAILAWRGEFHPSFGIVNQLLTALHFPAVGWWSEPLPIFISCCIVNIWLGIPFMMIVFLGGLQAIPRSCYEAASIDGASRWQQFCKVTLPLLKPTVIPSVTLGTIWTFNNVNVIFLMTGQDGGNEFADILVTALFKSAFTHSRYAFSAAFALIISALLMAITVSWIKISKGQEVV